MDNEDSTVADREAVGADGETRPRSGGLGSKIILLVFTGTLVTALLVSWISIQSTSAALRRMIDRLYPLTLEHAGGAVEPWIAGVRLQLERVTHDAEAGDPAGGEPILDGLAVYDAGGERLRAWGVAPDAARDALAAEGRVAEVTLEDGRPALAVAPLWTGRGVQVVGVVALAQLVPRLERELPDRGALLALLDADGRVLASAGTPPGAEPPARLPLAGLLARGALGETTLAGRHVLGAARPVGRLGWHVAIVTPFELAYGPVLAMVTRVLWIDLCIVGVFSLLAYRFTAHLVRPIGRLSEAARRVANGESDVDVPESDTRDEIGLLSRTFAEMLHKLRLQREEIEQTNRSLTDRAARLEQANEVLNQLSITDGLTKLHNHRFFQDHLTREIRRVNRTREDLAILLIDIDDFKSLNDRHGHAAGDEILTRIAQLLNGAVRGSDLCARYGGEEFVVLAPNTGVRGAYGLAEKIRTAIAESSFIVDDSMRPLRATVSIGVAAFGGNRKRFFQKADQALYQAKANGKNCVVVHDDDLPEAPEEPAGP